MAACAVPRRVSARPVKAYKVNYEIRPLAIWERSIRRLRLPVRPSKAPVGDSLATSGCIPENLDDAARDRRITATLEQIGNRKRDTDPFTDRNMFLDSCRAIAKFRKCRTHRAERG
jgi:hypothetical protein